ncbi:unnamed protein product, partial [Closterium sp. Naga37s-1]
MAPHEQLSPIPNGGGIEMLEAGTFDLHCFRHSQVRPRHFFPFHSTKPVKCRPFSHRVLPFTPIPTLLHLLMPWHQVEMPIRCDLFDLHLPAAIRKDRSLLATGVVVPGRSY